VIVIRSAVRYLLLRLIALDGKHGASRPAHDLAGKSFSLMRSGSARL
jgi:hypothetical protein